MRPLLASVALVVSLLVASSVEAAISFTELTSGSTVDSASGVTASISPTGGAILILFETHRKNTCTGITVTGAGVTWTQRDTQSIISGVFTLSMWTAVSNGTSGAVTIGFTGSCSNIAWDIVQGLGVNTLTTDGYVTSSHTNLTGCSPCALSQSWGGGFGTANAQVSSCMANFGPGTFTKDGTGGWTAGTTVNTANSGAGDILTLGVQWKSPEASEGQTLCTMGPAGAANSMIVTSEINAGLVRHKVTEN